MFNRTPRESCRHIISKRPVQAASNKRCLHGGHTKHPHRRTKHPIPFWLPWTKLPARTKHSLLFLSPWTEYKFVKINYSQRRINKTANKGKMSSRKLDFLFMHIKFGLCEVPQPNKWLPSIAVNSLLLKHL